MSAAPQGSRPWDHDSGSGGHRSGPCPHGPIGPPDPEAPRSSTRRSSAPLRKSRTFRLRSIRKSRSIVVMEIEFDTAKDEGNIAKHGISLIRAVDLFATMIVEIPDARYAYGE